MFKGSYRGHHFWAVNLCNDKKAPSKHYKKVSCAIKSYDSAAWGADWNLSRFSLKVLTSALALLGTFMREAIVFDLRTNHSFKSDVFNESLIQLSNISYFYGAFVSFLKHDNLSPWWKPFIILKATRTFFNTFLFISVPQKKVQQVWNDTWVSKWWQNDRILGELSLLIKLHRSEDINLEIPLNAHTYNL